MWMDHRAVEQASSITNTGHKVLSRVGGVMSPEMQPPKLLWLKENLRESCWDKAAHFFDLPDFLSWKATGSLTRSLCTVVCKWMYCPPDGWDESFWTSIGLEDLLENNFSKIGSKTSAPGSPLGDGLTQEAAAELGLNPGTAVGSSLIDAHAGGLGITHWDGVLLLLLFFPITEIYRSSQCNGMDMRTRYTAFLNNNDGFYSVQTGQH
uniref:Carbohydrate kinase FGGY N-terminal domain-containing protein n=1 Tax=Cynoglossus semilaevis TaxID=244447 RepID=A0A3P8WEK1_CYNSE